MAKVDRFFPESIGKSSTLYQKDVRNDNKSRSIRNRKMSDILKVGFSQKVTAKFSNLSNCRSCEPIIAPALLIPVNDNKKKLAIL